MKYVVRDFLCYLGSFRGCDFVEECVRNIGCGVIFIR